MLGQAEVDKQVIGLLKPYIEERWFPGCIALLYTMRTGPISVALGRHTYDLDAHPVSEDSIYDIASLTKVIVTTTALMQLFERGQISLSDPAYRFLPEFKFNGKHEITIWNLLTHTDGLGSLPPSPAIWSSRQQIINTIYTKDLAFKPGTRFMYKDWGFIILGLIIEKITGTDLASHAYENIMQPLGLSHSFFNPPENLRGYIVPTEYDDRRGIILGEVHDEKAFVMGGIAGHAGLFSTADDLLRFAKAIVHCKDEHSIPLLATSSVDAMTRNQLVNLEVQQGLGWWKDDAFMGQYRRSTTIGHTGFTGTSIVLDLSQRTAVILLTNTTFPHRKSPEARRKLDDLRSRLSDLAFVLSGTAVESQ